MNTVRTISVNTTMNNPNVSFMLNIPFEVDMIRLVDCRSYSLFLGDAYEVCIPLLSFIPNQPLCLANTGTNCNPIEFHFKNSTPINGLHSMSLTFPSATGLVPQSFVSLILEFWSYKVGIPLEIRQTNWQNECVSVSDNQNTFALDVQFPVDEIIIEDMFFQRFNVSKFNSLTFYSDFLSQESVYTKTDTNSNKCRVAGATIGMCNWGTLVVRPNKIRYRFAQPITIRGNYTIWFRPDPAPYGAGGSIWSLWGNASFLFKFISYRV